MTTPAPATGRKTPLPHSPAKLIRAMDRRRVSAAELARAAGVSRSVVTELRKGTKGCSADVLNALEDALSVPRGSLQNKTRGVTLQRRPRPS